jgi:hypothetical protein
MFVYLENKNNISELENNFCIGWISGFGAVNWLFGGHKLV